jgi:hypothetical protein
MPVTAHDWLVMRWAGQLVEEIPLTERLGAAGEGGFS